MAKHEPITNRRVSLPRTIVLIQLGFPYWLEISMLVETHQALIEAHLFTRTAVRILLIRIATSYMIIIMIMTVMVS